MSAVRILVGRRISNSEIFRSNVDHYGWMRTFFKTAIWGAERYLGIHIFVVRVRPMEHMPSLPCTLPSIDFRLIQKDELLGASSDSELGLDLDFVQSAIERGDLAFGAFDESRLVSYVWRSVKSAPHEKNVWVDVDRPYCYAYKSFTRQSHRGCRLSPSVHLASDAYMFKKGYTHRIGFVSIINFPSLAAGKHMGSNPIGYAGYLSWFGRRLFFATRAVKNTGFEFCEPGATSSRPGLC